MKGMVLHMSVLGIELGSTRIKAVIIGGDHKVTASGNYDWENKLINGYWTYSLNDVWEGLRQCISKLGDLSSVSALGISAMMHGYLAFDKNGEPLVPFRTWRNTTTEQAASELTELFGFNIPQRWSIAHLYQAILNKEPHVKDIAFITTLSGYVHWKLTGEKVIGMGDASGMFPVEDGNYRRDLADKFKDKTGIDIFDIFPKALMSGQEAGKLTAYGAEITGLNSGIPLCPPEGDAGTGMVATNSVSVRTGNVSAGTSSFAMVVLDKQLPRIHREIDMVTTPDGKPVAMAHCNNCTGDIDAWVKLFGEVSDLPKYTLYDLFYNKALEGDADCGGLLSYNYFAGEPVTEIEEGRPLFVRKPDANFTLPNFCRSILFSSIATLKIGMDILTAEGVVIDKLLGHGGLFKTPKVGQKLMAAALNVPVSVMSSAGEGGAWGIALLADYMLHSEKSLPDYLTGVFTDAADTEYPDKRDVDGFGAYLERYKTGLALQKTAAKTV
jgi:sugar (pentulose or hexulose) kinase